MPQGPYGRGPSQINIPVQKRKQKRMIKRTKERKKKETKKKKTIQEKRKPHKSNRQYIQSSLTHAASGTRKSVSGASLLQERFIQVESSKRGFMKVGVG